MGSAMILLLLATSFASASEPPRGQSSGNCPEKWIDASFADMGCLYFNSTLAMTWDEASSMCQMGSDSTLLVITSEMQLAFIQMELDVIADYEGATHYWWTAGTDVGINGQWVWATTFTAVEDFIWGGDFPSDIDNFNCLVLNSGSGSDHNLGANWSCGDPYYPICQLK